MSDTEPHEEYADKLDRQVDRMQDESEQVGSDIEDARKDWEAKQRAGDVGPPPSEPEPGTGDLSEAASADDEG